MTPRKLPSQRARELHAKHPTWSLQRIAEACGISKQGVANALKQTGKRGRPWGVAGKKKGATASATAKSPKGGSGDQ